MHGSRFALMLDHVRAIHRAVTGSDPPPPAAPVDPAQLPSAQAVERRFADLEAFARAMPLLAERVPPFSFAPPVDVLGTERELVIELGLPGVERSDVEVELLDGTIIVSGARGESTGLDGRVYFRAEMPRGPFRRALRLPEPTHGAPRVEVDGGIVRVRLQRSARTSRPQA
jgi:HSP20 family molecular chaperone IbpA